MLNADNNGNVADFLGKSVGVTPSNQWLDACQSFLRRARLSSTNDAILNQILKSDLRDVVRHSDGSTAIGGFQRGEQEQHVCPSKRLRSAIQDSQTRTQSQNAQIASSHNSRESSMVATLSAPFRLMCQVEEVLDVSLNSEARLDGGASTSTEGRSRQNKGPRLRCLKFCISDGYDSVPIVAMETSPIPNLFPTSNAGMKIVISGPIEVRWGMLQCHAGNTLVLGGLVQELADLQRKAIAQAKQAAGVGVDLTIRALIGTAPIEPEEEQDEGEGESGDVVAPADPPIVATRQLDISGPLSRTTEQSMPPTSNVHRPQQSTSTCQETRTGYTQSANQSLPTGQALSSTYPVRQNTSTARPLATTTNMSNRNPYAQSSSAANSSRYSKLTASTSHQQVSSSNPYSKAHQMSNLETNKISSTHARSNFVTASTLANSASAAHQQPSNRLNNIPRSTTSNVIPMEIDEIETASIPAVILKSTAAASVPPVDKISDNSSPSSISTLTVTPRSAPPNMNRASSRPTAAQRRHQMDSIKPTASPSDNIMTFANLRKLLLQLVSNKELYNTYYGQVFTVNLVQKGPLVYYNVGKRKDRKKKKGSKKSGDEGLAEKVSRTGPTAQHLLHIPALSFISSANVSCFPRFYWAVRICCVCQIRRSRR